MKQRMLRTYDRFLPARKRDALRRAAGAMALIGGVALAGCQPIVDYRGFVPQETALEQVRVGSSKAQVEELLGTPSAQSTVGGGSYYYISSVFETTAFYEPEEVDRKVYAIEFDQQDTVQRVAYYGLKDGRVFDFISRTTPTRGKELSLVQELFGNLGRFNDATSVVRDRVGSGGAQGR